MQNKIIIPISTDHSGKTIELSTEDALRLSPYENGTDHILESSLPYMKAKITSDKIEFKTDSDMLISISLDVVKDTINKQYYIGQKFTPNQR